MAQLIIAAIVVGLIWWIVGRVVWVIAILTLLVAGVAGLVTYHLLGLGNMGSDMRLGIATAVGVVTTAAVVYHDYGGWGLVVAIVCVGYVLAKLNG